MVVLDIYLDNFYAFKKFHANFTYPKKIVGSIIKDEHLKDRPNFRYKKVNIIMGANASGKTTLGHITRMIFNFIDKKNYKIITNCIGDQKKEASFRIDLASNNNNLYRVKCTIPPSDDGEFLIEDINLEIHREKILVNDSYESCVKRLETKEYIQENSYLEELEKIEKLDWFFEYPRDNDRKVELPSKDEKFKYVLENILKALDPAIQKIEKLESVDNAYVIRLQNKDIILKDGEKFDTEFLSSGTKAGVEVARVISDLIQDNYTFYYCDEKFSYIHSDIEKAILSLMADSIQSNSQLFFTSHNTDLLNMNFPKHTFSFLKKDADDEECPIKCISASSLLKRSTDSLKNAVENDMFCTAPAVDLIYEILEI